MPFVHLEESQVSLFYRTSFGDDINQLDKQKPTVVLLHGIFLSTEFLSPQFEYAPLIEKANLIAFDQLCCGKTENPTSPRRDASVEAAAIVLGLEKLGISTPVHLFASQTFSVNVALKIALLWPSKAESLCLCGISGPLEELEWLPEALQAWGFSQDIDSLEESMVPLLHYNFGDSQRLITPHERDAVIAYWETRYPPFKRASLLDVGLALLQPSFATQHLSSITQPVLILHGDSAAIHATEAAETFRSAFTNAKGGAKLRSIPAGPGNLHYPRFFANLINPYYVDFLTSFAQENALELEMGSLAISADPSAVIRPGFEKISQLVTVHPPMSGDPITIWSLSTVSDEKVKRNLSLMSTFEENQASAYSPLREDGNPIRKFSERDFERLFEPIGAAQDRRPSIDMFKLIEVESVAE